MKHQSDEHDRDEWLVLEDDALLRQCEVDTYRASGPGGQKRNKTSSAVRLRHAPSGLLVIAEESRSQHENKARALRRLRRTISTQIRIPVMPDWKPPAVLRSHQTLAGGFEISLRSAAYPLFAAVILDIIAAQGGRMHESAEMVGATTSQLSKLICRDLKLLAVVNQIRGSNGLKALRDS